MTQAVAVQQGGALATTQAPESQALASDTLVPRLLLMQGLSDFVADRKAMQGDMVRSTNIEKLGDDKNPIEFIPLSIQNTWIVKELVGEKFEFRKSVPRRAIVKPEDVAEETKRDILDKQADNSPWEFAHLGSKWKRVKAINVFALLPRDIAAFEAEIKKAQETGEIPDLDKTLMPVLISFQSTSFNAGKAVSTHFTKVAAMAQYGAKAHAYALGLSCSQEKNDKGTYFVFGVNGSRKLTKDELAHATKWAAIVNGGAELKVHQVEEDSGSGLGESQF